MSVSIVVAFSQNFVIGSGNEIPWYIREDLLYFKEVTMDKIVITTSHGSNDLLTH
jgi:dihydrofolate reductase